MTEQPDTFLDAVSRIKPLADFYDHTYISLRDNYLFHTVGKAANSTVKLVFYGRELEERGRALPSVHDRAASPLMSPYQLSERLLTSVIEDPKFTRFTFVRNPYSRLLSCFLDRIAKVRARPHIQFVRLLGKPPAYRPTFEEFIETICAQKPRDQNNHWRVQYDDALVELIPYDFIGKQENFAADMDRVMSLVTGEEERDVVGGANASPTQTSSSSRLGEYYTPRLARLVQDRYARDFSEFGYEPEQEWIAGCRVSGVARTPSPEPAPRQASNAPAKAPEQSKPKAVGAPSPSAQGPDAENRPLKRSIRLKEFGPNANRTLSPAPAYLRQTNGTIEGKEFTLRTDENGFIVSPGCSDRKGPRTFMLGDSFVECSFIAEGKRLCDRMNEGLDREGGLVLNGGYSGSTTLHALHTLLAKVIPNRPRTVVYVLPSNDVPSLMQSAGFWNLADKRYSPIIPTQPLRGGSEDFLTNAQTLGPLLEQFCFAAEAHGFTMVLATMPFVASDYHGLGWFRIRHRTDEAYQALIEKRRHLNKIVRDVTSRRNVPLLELEDRLSSDLFYDDVHLNTKGCEEVAKIALEMI